MPHALRIVARRSSALLVAGILTVVIALSMPAGAIISIIGGGGTQPGQYPFVVSMQHNGSHLCGGSVVAPTWILTAAHCAAAVNNAPAGVTVVINRHDLRTNAGSTHGVAQVIPHPDYDPATIRNDVALLELTQPTNVAPVTLTQPGDDALEVGGTPLVVSGWGAIEPTGLLGGSPTKRSAIVEAQSDRACSQRYNTVLLGIFPFDPNTMLCAGALLTDACFGDSGGPLFIDRGGVWTQVGVVSWGLPICAVHPLADGVYAEVNAGSISGFLDSVL